MRGGHSKYLLLVAREAEAEAGDQFIFNKYRKNQSVCCYYYYYGPNIFLSIPFLGVYHYLPFFRQESITPAPTIASMI